MRRALGYDAEALPGICEAVLQARADGVLHPRQLHIAAASELIARGLMRVGIIALVDEATGYQKQRAQDALAEILEQFIAKELRPYIRLFPSEFYENLFRLRGLADSDEVARAFRDDAAHGFRHDVAQGVCLAGC
jgi:hypothetical protein